MKKIDPVILKQLREARGWTQDALAEKTKIDDLPKIDKQTISRLERGDRSKTRSRTIDQLARALSVEPEVLTGEKQAQRDASYLNPRPQLNMRVGTRPHNALSLAARRYRVEPSQIVELAPFLFVWAAEECLRQRRERADAFDEKLEEVRTLGWTFDHLRPRLTLGNHEEAIGDEWGSIEKRDLFGRTIKLNFDVETENPFAVFLRKITEPFGDIAKFEEWSGAWTPQYRVCPEEAAALVGGDRDRAEEILGGLVALSEMPKEIRKPDMAKERAEWVRSKAEEYHKQTLRDLGLASENVKQSK